MNLLEMEKYNRLIGTLIISAGEKHELPGKFFSFNSDKLFSRYNKTSAFGEGHFYYVRDP